MKTNWTVRTIASGALTFLLVGLIGLGGAQILAINARYERESEVRGEMERFKPDFADETEAPAPGAAQADAPEGETRPNQSVSDARRDINGDIVGWLTIPNTAIDYPFAQADDNDYYLHRDINKKSAAAGTIFMDSRCDKGFSDFNTILYGHHMKNGSMLGGLASFESETFFEENETGYIFLADETLRLRIFALLVVRPDDAVYRTAGDGDARKTDFLESVRENARLYRDIGVTAEDNIVTLSTCAYEFNGARLVLLARLEPFLG
jgi:sortase B